MKKSLFAIALLAGVAACGTPAETTDGGEVAEATESGVYHDLGGEASSPIYTVTAEDTLAVRGYDVVSYFVGEGVPVEGSEEFTVLYQGYEYRFANAENADRFIEDPDQYAPAYGGYCAWALGANDSLAEGDPNVYEIVDGRLFLNFNEQVQGNWQADQANFIVSADENYPAHPADQHHSNQFD